MRIVIPITVDDDMLLSTTITTNDDGATRAEWDESTTYADGDRIVVTDTGVNKVYESVAGSNLGNYPPDDTESTWWVEIGAVDGWKPFDGYIADQVSATGSIVYVFRMPATASGVVCFGLDADSVTVKVEDDVGGGGTLYEETKSASTSAEDEAWLERIYGDIDFDADESDYIPRDDPDFLDIPAYEGYKVTVTITKTGQTVSVGQIVLGEVVTLGTVQAQGTTVSAEDYSVKEQNDFGYVDLVQRDYADAVTFSFLFPTSGAQRVDKIITMLRASPVVWIMESETSEYGTTVYGWWDDYTLSLDLEWSQGSISVRGLT